MVARSPRKKPKSNIRYEAVKLDTLFEVLDAVAWLPSPSAKQISQFANIPPHCWENPKERASYRFS